MIVFHPDMCCFGVDDLVFACCSFIRLLVAWCRWLRLRQLINGCCRATGAAWSWTDPWLFASLSYDGRFVVNRVPNQTKYKVLL